MATLKDLINLAKADGGKFFVVDEKGDASLVIMSIEDYQKLLLGKLQRQVEDVEKINKQIIEAQLKEAGAGPEIPKPASPTAKPELFSPRQDLNGPRRGVDLREEVIDPSFDFEGPKVDIDDL